jgi:hypothetical protein
MIVFYMLILTIGGGVLYVVGKCFYFCMIL